MKDSQIRQHVTNLVDAVKDLFLDIFYPGNQEEKEENDDDNDANNSKDSRDS
jgi:hypothetical protein